MKAMILAAGCGERMGTLTAEMPKVLLKVGNKALIDFHLEKLAAIGITEVVVNTHYMADKIQHYLGDGTQYGLHIATIFEPELLGMGGGVYNALPLLGKEPFIVVSGDMWTDYDYGKLPQQLDGLAHIVLVDNPSYHAQGNFQLTDNYVLPAGQHNLTYAGFGVYRAELFTAIGDGTYTITTALEPAIAVAKVSGEHYFGAWENVNTPQQLQHLRKQYEI